MFYAGLKLVENGQVEVFENQALAVTHSPTGLDKKRRKAFMRRFGLRKSTAKKSVRSLLGRGRRLPGIKRRGRHLWDEKRAFPDALGWFDHVEMFYRKEQDPSCAARRGLFDGSRTVLTAQPYDLTPEKYAALEEFCREHGLFCEISYQWAWWYPGKTPLVVVVSQERLGLG